MSVCSFLTQDADCRRLTQDSFSDQFVKAFFVRRNVLCILVGVILVIYGSKKTNSIFLIQNIVHTFSSYMPIFSIFFLLLSVASRYGQDVGNLHSYCYIALNCGNPLHVQSNDFVE